MGRFFAFFRKLNFLFGTFCSVRNQWFQKMDALVVHSNELELFVEF